MRVTLTSIAQMGIVLKYRCFNGLSYISRDDFPAGNSPCEPLSLQIGTGDSSYDQQ
jgi:hypothetical protein